MARKPVPVFKGTIFVLRFEYIMQKVSFFNYKTVILYILIWVWECLFNFFRQEHNGKHLLPTKNKQEVPDLP
ncbi:hypothetical protein ACC675_37085, partial [Rhizobium ruizarguesonis]